MRDERAPFGGELSGHFYFVDNFYGHDDGAIASLRLLAYLSRVNQSLKQVISKLPHDHKNYQQRKNVRLILRQKWLFPHGLWP